MELKYYYYSILQFWMAHLKIHIRLLISKWSRSHAYQSQSCGLKNRQIASVWTREKRDCASGRQKKAETLFFLFNIWGQNIYGLAFWVLINLCIFKRNVLKRLIHLVHWLWSCLSYDDITIILDNSNSWCVQRVLKTCWKPWVLTLLASQGPENWKWMT